MEIELDELNVFERTVLVKIYQIFKRYIDHLMIHRNGIRNGIGVEFVNLKAERKLGKFVCLVFFPRQRSSSTHQGSPRLFIGHYAVVRDIFMQMQSALYVKSSVWSVVNGAKRSTTLSRPSSDVLIDFADNLWLELAKLFVNRILNTCIERESGGGNQFWDGSTGINRHPC